MMAPDYYREFCCIAHRCKHSCCKGWEIDIDPDTLEMYQQMEGEWGEKLRSQIDICEETASFHLKDDESCPFLNESGLCDLILEFGEEVLCQICTDHPRFYHEYEDRTEVGLGLCCEEAARLILCKEDPVQMVVLVLHVFASLLFAMKASPPIFPFLSSVSAKKYEKRSRPSFNVI